MGSKLHVTHGFLIYYLMGHPSTASGSKAKKRRTEDVHGLKPRCEEVIKDRRAATTADINDDFEESGVQFGGLIPEGQTDDVEAQAISAKNGKSVGKPTKANQYVACFI
jgi:hypothetical protein